MDYGAFTEALEPNANGRMTGRSIDEESGQAVGSAAAAGAVACQFNADVQGGG